MYNIQNSIKEMKIVYVIEDFAVGGGVERIVSEKANLLTSQYGHNVTIISVYKDKRIPKYTNNVRTIFLNIPMAGKSSNRIVQTFNRTATFIKAVIKLNTTIRKLNPDIIFFTTTLGALLLPLCHTKAKKVYESHLARAFNPYNTLFASMERNADTIVCLTEDDAKEYKHARTVRVIPNFINIQTRPQVDYTAKKAIAVGRLENQKGFDILINIWAKIHEQLPDWQLHIYGEGEQRQELQQMIDSTKMNSSITLCGRCEDMLNKYAEYSLHIMTSRYEGLPMTLIEAQSCGLPSVVFNFKYGAKEIINNKVNGLIINQHDNNAFAKALLYMMNDADIRKTYGENAIEIAAAYSVEHVMPKWENLIHELLKK